MSPKISFIEEEEEEILTSMRLTIAYGTNHLIH
jgi:hypothetical protein